MFPIVRRSAGRISNATNSALRGLEMFQCQPDTLHDNTEAPPPPLIIFVLPLPMVCVAVVLGFPAAYAASPRVSPALRATALIFVISRIAIVAFGEYG